MCARRAIDVCPLVVGDTLYLVGGILYHTYPLNTPSLPLPVSITQPLFTL